MEFAPHSFSLRQLQYAVAVAELSSFRRAAERCHVSQPSLSTQIAQLEEVIGVQLFERDRRRVLLTLAGGAVIERARQVLAAADDLVETARRSRDPFSGSLRIGIIPTVSPYLLPSVAPALRGAYPRLGLRWVEDKTDTLVRELALGNLDAVLLAREADIGDLEQELIARDPFVLAAPEGHPLSASRDPARPAELGRHGVLLLDDGHCFRDQALAVCARSEASELEFRATSLSTLSQMVAAGAGVTLLPELAVPTEASRAELAVRPFTEPAPHRTLVLAWRKSSPLSGTLRQLASTIRAAYPQLPTEPLGRETAARDVRSAPPQKTTNTKRARRASKVAARSSAASPSGGVRQRRSRAS